MPWDSGGKRSYFETGNLPSRVRVQGAYTCQTCNGNPHTRVAGVTFPAIAVSVWAFLEPAPLICGEPN